MARASFFDSKAPHPRGYPAPFLLAASCPHSKQDAKLRSSEAAKNE